MKHGDIVRIKPYRAFLVYQTGKYPVYLDTGRLIFDRELDGGDAWLTTKDGHRVLARRRDIESY